MASGGGLGMNRNYFVHKSQGIIKYDLRKNDPKMFKPFWAFVVCDQGIIDYYSWLSKRWGKSLTPTTAWGPHISWCKGEEPLNKDLWGKEELVEFHYSNIVRWDNLCHAWIDVHCPYLHEVRYKLGLEEKERKNFHITLGRI